MRALSTAQKQRLMALCTKLEQSNAPKHRTDPSALEQSRAFQTMHGTAQRLSSPYSVWASLDCPNAIGSASPCVDIKSEGGAHNVDKANMAPERLKTIIAAVSHRERRPARVMYHSVRLMASPSPSKSFGLQHSTLTLVLQVRQLTGCHRLQIATCRHVHATEGGTQWSTTSNVLLLFRLVNCTISSNPRLLVRPVGRYPGGTVLIMLSHHVS